MESKRAAARQSRYQGERQAGSVLTGPRMSGLTGRAAAWENAALNAPDAYVRETPREIQNAATGVIAFVLDFSALDDGSKLL